MTKRRAKASLWVTLDWGDRVGFNCRTLPVVLGCPDCGGHAFKRLDTHRKCAHALYVPVECLRCQPSSYWAQPKAPASSAAIVAAAERRSLRARVRGFVDAVTGRLRGKGGRHGS